jgi:hypothetical protein
MDAGEHRHVALVLTIGFVVVLTGLITWGVVHKINKKIIEPTKPEIGDIIVVPDPKGK